ATAPSAAGPTLDAVIEPTLTYTALETYGTSVSTSATTWWDAAKVRMPFALGMAWLPDDLDVSSGDCEGVSMTILETEQEVGLCGTAFDTFLAGTGRMVLLGVLLLGWYFASAQVLTRL